MTQNIGPKHRFAKRAVLQCKMHHFRVQNAPFWSAKLALLETDTNYLGKRIAFSWVSAILLAVYYQLFITRANMYLVLMLVMLQSVSICVNLCQKE